MRKKTNNYSTRNFKKKRGEDKLSKQERSERMAKIRSRGTKFEKDFIAKLEKSTRKKFKINDITVLGKPDIVFIKYKVCVFLDSDFWHGWQYPRWKHLLKNNFWREKIERNRKRDIKVTQTLRKQGWTVLRFWEHNIKKNKTGCVRRVVESIKIN